MADVLRIARKEFRVFFATPAAYLFIGAFLTVTLFVFFWVETFFARNIADVRPLFQWLPVLLIFLVAALTMRSWSEERRAGTLESLLTAPVRPVHLVLGKFLATLALVALALALTLMLPVTAALLGPLDWGPVIGGYVATLFLAAAYAAIGLYMSGRTDNPIVALILTAVVCGLFYLIGSDTLTTLFGRQVGGVLALLGAGTRFESITRGVLDLRDLYYYVSIVAVFLTLNLYSLERLRWAGNPVNTRHRQWSALAVFAAANFAAANLWLAPLGWARADFTESNIYSLSGATHGQLARLREPMTIRGYFSARTHPLLAPLVPQLEDLLEEYALAADGRARVEFIDPTQDRRSEEEAASRYGIRPVPFQTANRYQSAVVSSYFDVVVAYGDEYETLGYADLIEVKARGEGELDVVLKDPEYSITRAMRKVIDAYQAGGSPFTTLDRPVIFNGYISPDDQLPESLQALRAELETLLEELEAQANGRLTVNIADPEAQGGALAERLELEHGFGPQIASLLDPAPFWFYMVLESEGETVQVPLPETLEKDALERSIEAALRRLAPGFLKTVAVVKPQGVGPGAKRYSRLEAALEEDVRLENSDLTSGRVPEEADLLLVLSPSGLSDTQRFAIDQFLMRGGSVVLANSPFDVDVSQSLTATPATSGLEEWLAHHGIELEDTLVLDPRNAALPIPVERYVSGIALREIRMVPYPHFPDLRGASLNDAHPITAGLEQLTLNWASPLVVDASKNAQRTLMELLRSSEGSWTSESMDVVPDYTAHPDTGFAATDEREPQLLAVAVEGRFDSFYADRESPLARAAAEEAEAAPAATDEGGAEAGENAGEGDPEPVVTGVVERSPESARLVVIGSNTFAADTALDLASQGLSTRYTKPVEFLQNAVDWSLEDQSLLELRGRTQLARMLLPLSENAQRFWEYLNYAVALLGLAGVWVWRRYVMGADRRRYESILAEVRRQ